MSAVCVIRANVNDDADYEYMTDNAIHNTLQPYWKWAEDAGVNVEFTKEYDRQGYGLELLVIAKFDCDRDCKDFQINHFNQFPHKKMQNLGQKYYFE